MRASRRSRVHGRSGVERVGQSGARRARPGRRLALKCAANACRLAGRTGDEVAQRDVWMLRKPGDDPGQTGAILGAFRLLAAQPPMLDRDILASVADQLCLRWDEAFVAIPGAIEVLVHAGPAAPFAAVAVIRSAKGQAEGLVRTCIAYFQPITRAELSTFFGKEISRDLIGVLHAQLPVRRTLHLFDDESLPVPVRARDAARPARFRGLRCKCWSRQDAAFRLTQFRRKAASNCCLSDGPGLTF